MKFHANKQKTEFQVGLFTILAIIILVLAYAWFAEVLANQKYTSIKVGFSNAGNLEIGSDVCINGVKKGRVKSITVKPQGVIVELKTVLDFPLKSGTEFKILESNLMGDARVEITPGSGKENLDLTLIFNGERKIGLAGLIAEMGGIVSDLESVLSKISEQDDFIENLQIITDTTRVVMNKINSSIDRNSVNIENLIEHSTALIQQITGLVEENENKLSGTLDNSEKVFAELNDTLREMNSLISNFEQISHKMLQDDNSFSRLISEQELYDNLLKVTSDMDSLLLDIKKNPKKYFEVKIF